MQLKPDRHGMNYQLISHEDIFQDTVGDNPSNWIVLRTVNMRQQQKSVSYTVVHNDHQQKHECALNIEVQ